LNKFYKIAADALLTHVTKVKKQNKVFVVTYIFLVTLINTNESTLLKPYMSNSPLVLHFFNFFIRVFSTEMKKSKKDWNFKESFSIIQ